MNRDLNIGRRAFLAGSAGLLASRNRCGTAGDKSSSGEDFITTTQQRPAPKVQFPTDRLPAPTGPKKRIIAIATTWYKYSHADDIITKFIEGYEVVGRTHLPHCKVVGMHVEQFPDSDISRGMAKRYGIPMFKTPAEALTLGGKELACDGVLLVGEHGDYPINEKGQKLYPRRRLFEEIVKVFRASGRSIPVFNDKHLSFSWENAKWMYEQSRELNFPLMAGSSVPVAWREPPLAFRCGIPLEHAVAAGHGSFESYGFHSLELLQAFVEKRKGGETGVKSVQALLAEDADRFLMNQPWAARLQQAAAATAPQSNRRANSKNKQSAVFRIEYADDFEAAVCLTRGLDEFCFAADVKGQSKPVATYARLPKPSRDHFSFLCNHIESMFRTGKASYAVERTLLTTGVLDALHDSRQAGGKRLETPHLSQIRYTPAEDFGITG